MMQQWQDYSAARRCGQFLLAILFVSIATATERLPTAVLLDNDTYLMTPLINCDGRFYLLTDTLNAPKEWAGRYVYFDKEPLPIPFLPRALRERTAIPSDSGSTIAHAHSINISGLLPPERDLLMRLAWPISNRSQEHAATRVLIREIDPKTSDWKQHETHCLATIDLSTAPNGFFSILFNSVEIRPGTAVVSHNDADNLLGVALPDSEDEIYQRCISAQHLYKTLVGGCSFERSRLANYTAVRIVVFGSPIKKDFLPDRFYGEEYGIKHKGRRQTHPALLPCIGFRFNGNGWLLAEDVHDGPIRLDVRSINDKENGERTPLKAIRRAEMQTNKGLSGYTLFCLPAESRDWSFLVDLDEELTVSQTLPAWVTFTPDKIECVEEEFLLKFNNIHELNMSTSTWKHYSPAMFPAKIWLQDNGVLTFYGAILMDEQRANLNVITRDFLRKATSLEN